ncbi:hypothetical protein R0K18_36280, partial [Pantoea sp. SIMBA_133]
SYTTAEEIIEKQADIIRSFQEDEEDREFIGEVCVDSGQLMIIDPCYLHEWKSGEYGAEDGNHYDQACKASLSDKKY